MLEKNRGDENLTLLGSGTTIYPSRPEDAVLEVIPNLFTQTPYRILLECPEFTSLCPRTSQPDFARIVIEYFPKDKLIESKALKLYLFSFRNEGMFHEFVVNKIATDLNDAMQPLAIRVQGLFFPRGGISIHPEVILGDVTLFNKR